MENKIPEEYKIAYAEIDYILNHMNKDYVAKIPNELLNFFEEVKDKNYNVHLEKGIPLHKNNLKEYTFEVLNVLNLNFWCQDENDRNSIMQVLMDKPVEFTINEHMKIAKGQELNYFKKIVEEDQKRKEELQDGILNDSL